MISSTDTDPSWLHLSLMDEPPQVQEKTIARNTVDMYLEKYPTRTVKSSEICTNIPELLSEKERSVYAETANGKVGKLVWDPDVVEYGLFLCYLRFVFVVFLTFVHRCREKLVPKTEKEVRNCCT